MPGSYSCQCNNGMDFDPNSFSCIRKYLTKIFKFGKSTLLQRVY